MTDYPKDIATLDLDSVSLPSTAVAAMLRLARSRPWRGTVKERKQKLLRLNADLAAAYGLPAPRVIFGLDGGDSSQSCYVPALRTIILRGRLSVITYTHEFYHHVLGRSESDVCRHSLALFKRCFPASWRRLQFCGHMARADQSRHAS